MKLAPKPSVSVIIPTYNGLHLLKKHLPSVMRTLDDQDELVIIDDASSDETINWLAHSFSARSWHRKVDGKTIKVMVGKHRLKAQENTVVIVSNSKNLRFARSVNKAVKISKHPFIFLLNNDVSPHPDALIELRKHTANPSLFAVGCYEIENDQTVGGKNKLWFEKGLFQHSRADDFTLGSTAWVSGGSGLYSKQKWLELGGFDTDYAPAYWEDIDLSFRARQKGWQVLFEPKAKVNHLHESTNQDVFGQIKIMEMSWSHADLFVHKHANLVQKLAYYWWKPYWWWQRRKAVNQLKQTQSTLPSTRNG